MNRNMNEWTLYLSIAHGLFKNIKPFTHIPEKIMKTQKREKIGENPKSKMLSRGLNQLMINILSQWFDALFFSITQYSYIPLYQEDEKHNQQGLFTIKQHGGRRGDVLLIILPVRSLPVYLPFCRNKSMIYQLSSVTVRYKYSFIILIRIDVVPFCSGL